MGGNALAEFGAQRVSPQRYEEVKNELYTILSANGIVGAVPFEMSGKEDFGDVDFVYLGDTLTKQKIVEIFGEGTPVARNGHVHSFLFHEVQVDMIHAKDESFDFHFKYLSYGDRGMIIGRLARSLRVIFGHDGLWFKEGSRKYLLTADWNSAIKFLGYDTHHRDHLDEEDLHKWLLSSTLVWQGYINADSENRKKRKRDRLRPSFERFFQSFLKDLRSYPSVSPIEDALSEADSAFPNVNLKERVNADLLFDKNNSDASAKWNGHHIRELVGAGLSDVEFGNFMRYYNGEFFDKQAKVNYILANPVERLEADTKQLFAKYIDDLFKNVWEALEDA